MKRKRSYQKCGAQHIGAWCIDPQWFAQAVAAVKAGTWKPGRPDGLAVDPKDPAIVGEWAGDRFKVRYYIEEGGIARIPFFGQVTKGESSFGGVSSVWVRQSLRKAVHDERVQAILLHIDSPGGTVAGTGDLADDIYAARAIKPVYTYFEDLGASAAVWVGSQSFLIFANPTAQVGSIGTMTYVEDTSGAYDKAGIKVTLIATGKLKGQWVDGNPVSEEYIASIRTQIFDLNEHFQQAVMRGRGFSREQMATVSDGNVFIADKAKQLGLIDTVCTLQEALAAISKEIGTMPITAQQFSQHAAENPQAAEVQALITQGYSKAQADLKPKAATAAELAAAFPDDPKFALDQATAGASLEQAKAAYSVALAAKLKAANEDLTKARADLEKHVRHPVPGGGNAGGNDAVNPLLADADRRATAAASRR